VTLVGYSEPGSSKKVEKCNVDNWWISCSTEEQNDGSNNTDKDGDSNYWKLQNSWGKNWGDNGFIKFEIQSGQGVCRINKYGIHWVDFDYSTV
jgi:hypothetical protein